MIEIKSRVRVWGRSFGVVLPKGDVKREGIEKDDAVVMLVSKKKDVLRETFNTLKFKKSTDEILKESDEEAWDE